MIRYVVRNKGSEDSVCGMGKYDYRTILSRGLLTLGCVALLTPAVAFAQGPPIPPSAYAPKPTFSPWLNLLRRDNSAAINYYGLVRPQQEFRFGIQQLQQQALTTQEALLATEGSSGLPTTGHQTRFLNFKHPYFGSGGSGQAPVTGTNARPTTMTPRFTAPRQTTSANLINSFSNVR